MTRSTTGTQVDRFSALQRAENSSIGDGLCAGQIVAAVSVLFSEPKIPQFSAVTKSSGLNESFSALQRAENSSIDRDAPVRRR